MASPIMKLVTMRDMASRVHTMPSQNAIVFMMK